MQSAAEVGTSAASINRTGKTNARKGIQSNYNDYKDFHEREMEAHICGAFMDMLSMGTLEGMIIHFIPIYMYNFLNLTS